MLVNEERLPVLNDFFRRLNKRASTISPLLVDASLRNIRMGEVPVKGSLDVNITEKETGRGVPFAPFTVYVNNVEEFLDRCDMKGKYTHELSLRDRRSLIDVYHSRKRLIEASDSLSVLWDNFDDNVLDRMVWETFAGAPAYYVGEAKTTEIRNRLEFLCSNTYYLAGVYTKKPIDVSESRIKARLYSGGWVICMLSILPSTTPFYGASYNNGYDVGIWQKGDDKFMVYSGKNTVYRKGTIRENPETIEVIVEDDIIRFLEEGSEVYSEKYKPASKLCNIYLWGQSWYHFMGGTSWVDDFLMVGGG